MAIPKRLPVDFVRIDDLEAASGFDRSTIYLWLHCGLLPSPARARGRSNFTRWPLITRDLVRFIARQRDLGYDLATIRERIGLAFGEEILDMLPEPKPHRPQDRRSRASPRRSGRPRKNG